jgi:hypothetical protein
MGGDVADAGLSASALGRRTLFRCRCLLARVLHEPTPLRRALEEEIEAGLDDLVAGCAGVRMRKGVARGLELLEEPARHRHVDARQLRVERFDRHRRRSGGDASGGRGRDIPNGCTWFGRPKLQRAARLGLRGAWDLGDRGLAGCGPAPHRRDDELARRRALDRADGGGNEGGVAARETEEPGQDLARVLAREHLRELDDGGEAKVPGPERRLDLRVLQDELGSGLPVLGGSCRQAQLPPEELEQAPVPERLPPAPAIEVREGDEEIGHRPVLAAEEAGEAGGLFACGRHAARVSRCVEAS